MIVLYFFWPLTFIASTKHKNIILTVLSVLVLATIQYKLQEDEEGVEKKKIAKSVIKAATLIMLFPALFIYYKKVINYPTTITMMKHTYVIISGILSIYIVGYLLYFQWYLEMDNESKPLIVDEDEIYIKKGKMYVDKANQNLNWETELDIYFSITKRIPFINSRRSKITKSKFEKNYVNVKSFNLAEYKDYAELCFELYNSQSFILNPYNIIINIKYLITNPDIGPHITKKMTWISALFVAYLSILGINGNIDRNLDLIQITSLFIIWLSVLLILALIDLPSNVKTRIDNLNWQNNLFINHFKTYYNPSKIYAFYQVEAFEEDDLRKALMLFEHISKYENIKIVCIGNREKVHTKMSTMNKYTNWEFYDAFYTEFSDELTGDN